MALSKLNNHSFDDTAVHGRRNLLINGAMQVAQRGTSVDSASGSGKYCIDRMRCFFRGAGTATFSQTTTVPSGQGFSNSLRVDVTGTDTSLAGNDLYMFDQRFEGQHLQHLRKGTSNALSTTVSFWVRSTKTGTYILELFDDDNNRGISKAYTISSADTWEFKEITFAGDTSGSLDNDNAVSLSVRWWLAAGTDYTTGTLQTSWVSNTNVNRAVGQVNFVDSTSNDFYITGVQLEVGEQATPFEHRSFAAEEIACNRYFYEASPKWIGLINADNTTITREQIQFPVRMRASPTVTNSGVSTNFSIGTVQTNDKAHNFEVSHAGATDFRPALVSPNFKFDAEL